MRLRKIRYVLFDLDGTLVDSVPDLAYCIDKTMSMVGLPERGVKTVRLWVGNGIEKLVARAVANSLEGEPEGETYEQALAVFLETYRQNHAQRSTVYPGVIEGLNWLQQQGIRMACVTNKAYEFTVPLLKKTGLFDYFDVVVGGDTCRHKKPHPAPLLHGIKALSGEVSQTLMVGDSKSDINAARAAGCPVIAVPYGYNHGEDIAQYQPDFILPSLAQLPECGLFQK